MRTLALSKIYSNSEKLEFCCPVCLFMCRDQTDAESVRDEGACTECYVNFRHVMGTDWDDGLRPSAEEARKRMLISKHT